MKKRVVSLLALLLCAVFVLGSCGANIKAPEFAEVYTGSNYVADAAFTAQTKVAELEGATVVGFNGNFLLFSKADDAGLVTYTAYNVAAGSTALKVTDTAALKNRVELVRLPRDEENVVFRVVAEDTATSQTTTSLYDVTGALIKGGVKGEQFVTTMTNLVVFDDVYYTVADGKLTELAKKNPLGKDYPSFSEYNELYYYGANRSGVEVYSATDLSLVKVFPFSEKYFSSDFEPMWFVLESGDIFFQGGYRLPDDASEYDFLKNEKKLAFDTFIFEVESGDVKELDFEYYVEDVLASNSVDYLYSVEQGTAPIMEFENIFYVYPFADEHLEYNEYLEEIFLVSNDGKIEGTLSEYLPAGNTDLPEPVANGKFILSDRTENDYLLNADGTVVGEANCDEDDRNANYIVAGGKIFNYDLAEVYDYEANNYELVAILADTVLLQREVKAADSSSYEYCLFKDGSVTTVVSADKKAATPIACTNFFTASYLENDKVVYIVYSSNGAQVLSLNTPISVVARTESAALISTMEIVEGAAPKLVYYRISK